MTAACARAVELGLPALAFTEHADFTESVTQRGGRLDVAGYRECLERCREQFADLVILSGVELGEPHRFPLETEGVLGSEPFDRVLGSVHCVPIDGDLTDAIALRQLGAARADTFMRAYLEETLALVESGLGFHVLTHLDYPKRYWPHDHLRYDERNYEHAFRAILRAAASRGIVLEVNTSRGIDPRRGLCPGPIILEWWCQEGGQAVALGSDAHDPSTLAMGFEHALDVIGRLGFQPPSDPAGHWFRMAGVESTANMPPRSRPLS